MKKFAIGLFACTFTVLSVFAAFGTETDIDWPKKNLTLYVSSSAGGPNDTMCRIAANELSKELNVRITVINRPGGSSWAVGDTLLNGKPDGYSFGSVVLPAFHKGYLDPKQTRKTTAENFIYLANLVTDPNLIYVRADDKRFPDMASFIAYAREHEVTVTATGAASDDDVAIQLLKMAVPGLKISPVFVPGSAQSIANVLGGHVDASIGNVGDSTNLHKDGQVRVLAVFAKERIKDYLPDVPTFNELKLSDVSVIADSKRGFFYPEGVDPKIVAKMINTMGKVFNSEAVKSQHFKAGIPVDVILGDDYRKAVMSDAEVMKKLAPNFGWVK